MKSKILICFLMGAILFPTMSFDICAKQVQYRNTIASADARVYAIDQDGNLFYWGKGTYNDEVGGQSPERAKPVKLMENVIGVYGEWFSSFAIKSDYSLWAIDSCGDGIIFNGKKGLRPLIHIQMEVKVLLKQHLRLLN